MTVPVNHVRLTCDDPKLNITVLLGPEPVRLAAGFGGWEVTQRPRQVGMTTWGGVEPFQVELSLMFDGYARQRSQERALRSLLAVARGDDESPPGVLNVAGVALPADDWVIEGIDYGDVIVDAHTRERLRQSLTLTLREYVPPEYLQMRKRALQGTKGKTKVITVKTGDTPASIARRQHCKWTDIRELNPSTVKKANQTLKRGLQLRVPVATTKTKTAKSRAKTKGASRTNR